MGGGRSGLFTNTKGATGNGQAILVASNGDSLAGMISNFFTGNKKKADNIEKNVTDIGKKAAKKEKVKINTYPPAIDNSSSAMAKDLYIQWHQAAQYDDSEHKALPIIEGFVGNAPVPQTMFMKKPIEPVIKTLEKMIIPNNLKRTLTLLYTDFHEKGGTRDKDCNQLLRQLNKLLDDLEKN